MRTTSEGFGWTLGIKTELFLERSRAQLDERSAFAVLRTPQNPGYYMGNCLLFERPPQSADVRVWPQLFAKAFALDPRVKHAAFQFVAMEGYGVAESFVAQGYTLEERAILVTDAIEASEVPQGLHLREFREENDWRQQLDMQMRDVPAIHDSAEYHAFKQLQVEHHRTITNSGGAWLGAFDGDRLVGSCGIFPGGERLARYQDVHVDVRYRNRGIAPALIGAAGRLAFQRFAAKRLVIAADANGAAHRIYERSGFTAVESEAALWRSHR